MEATSSFVILLSIAFMFEGDEFGFLPTKMKPQLQKECRKLVDAETYRTMEIAFDNMINNSKMLDLSELSAVSEDNYAKEVCKKSGPLFDSIGSFIVATRPCLNGAQKTKSHGLYALNKGIWGLVCSENEFRSALKCYEEKETDMAECFSGFQGCDTRSPEERIESCKEFKADLECSLEKLRECNPSKIGELAQQFIEHLGDEKICYDFSLAQTEWLHEVGLISTVNPIV